MSLRRRLTTMYLMAPKKKTTPDRHKPRRMVGVRGPLAEMLEQLATEEYNDLTEQVNRACLEYLERKGRLPEKNKPKA